MSYLKSTRSPSLLGAYGARGASPSFLGHLRRMGPSPSFLGSMRRRRRGLRGLSDDASDLMMVQPGLTAGQAALQSLPNYTGELPLDTQYWNAATLPTLATNTPVSPGSLTQGPVPQSLTNLLTGMTPPTDPLSFISPQAAIASGMDPATVYNAWAQSMAQFPTQQDALNAGVPAGVVTQLWGQSRAYVKPPQTSWWDSSTFGIANSTLVIGAGAALLLSAAFGKKSGSR